MKRRIFVILLSVFFASFNSILSASFYEWWNINLYWIAWNVIYPDDWHLKSTVIAYLSKADISNYSISSVCDVKSDFLNVNWDIYFFKVSFGNTSCKNPFVYLSNWKNIFLNTVISLKIVSLFSLINEYTDLDDSYLHEMALENLSWLKYSWDLAIRRWESLSFDRYTDIRKSFEHKYLLGVLNNIQQSREKKYLIPIVWMDLPKHINQLPNYSRSYRKWFTDWIHHWWDIKAPIEYPVVSVDDWIIIRIVRDFNYSDLSRINRSQSLTQDQQLTNLDMLRWNQVWLKTMKGDVVFYSHFKKVFNDIKVWDFISRWTPIWQVWISWVPSKNYKDYHLHFAIHKNPHDGINIWKQTLLEIMKWEWYFQWESFRNIVQDQTKIFET